MIDSTNVQQTTLKLALEINGLENQLNQLQEECAELIVAVNHYRRSRVGKEKIAEEIADVFIMCNEISGAIGDYLVDQQVKDKMHRLSDKLKTYIDQVYGSNNP